MFYEGKAFCITNVFGIKRPGHMSVNKGRIHSALSFRISGQARFEYQNKTVQAGAGQIVYVPAGVDYKLTEKEEELIVLHLKVCGDPGSEIECYEPRDSPVVAKVFAEIRDTWQGRRPGCSYRCTALLYQIFAMIEDEKSREFYTDGENRLIRDAVLYLRAHFTDPDISVSGLAHIAGLSEVYFRKLYQAQFHCSPLRDINRMRIGHACQLLASGYYNVSETAAQSGFLNAKYFSTLFKKLTGTTPSAYRRRFVY